MLQKITISLLIAFFIGSAAMAQDVKKDTLPGTKARSELTPETKKDTIPGTKGKLDVAPETKLEKTREKQLYSVAQFGRESVLFVKQPLRWKRSDWLTVGALAGGTVLLTFADQPLRNTTQGQQQYNTSAAVVGGRMYGEWYSIGGVAGAFALYGIIAKDTSAKKIAIELFQAGVYSEFVTQIVKMAVGRARPYMNEGPGSFRPFIGPKTDYNSFPSGHSTSAFALSTVMARHARSVGLKILAYVPAGFTLFSRIYQDKHWISDELIGAALGYFVGNWVVDLHEARRHKINVAAITK